MTTYLFHLGREPGLSMAEIESLFAAEAISGEGPQLIGHSLEIDVPAGLDPRSVIGRLGGSVRIAERIASLDPGPSEKSIADILFDEIRRSTGARQGKLSFGLSHAGSSRQGRFPIEDVAKTVKGMARKDGLSVRFVLPR